MVVLQCLLKFCPVVSQELEIALNIVIWTLCRQIVLTCTQVTDSHIYLCKCLLKQHILFQKIESCETVLEFFSLYSLCQDLSPNIALYSAAFAKCQLLDNSTNSSHLHIFLPLPFPTVPSPTFPSYSIPSFSFPLTSLPSHLFPFPSPFFLHSHTLLIFLSTFNFLPSSPIPPFPSFFEEGHAP